MTPRRNPIARAAGAAVALAATAMAAVTVQTPTSATGVQGATAATSVDGAQSTTKSAERSAPAQNAATADVLAALQRANPLPKYLDKQLRRRFYDPVWVGHPRGRKRESMQISAPSKRMTRMMELGARCPGYPA